MKVSSTKETLMELRIDGEPISIDLERIKTLEDLITHIEREVVIDPRVVTRIVLNDEELDEGQQVGLGAFSVDDVATLSVETADKFELSFQALSDAQEYLPALSELLETSAKLIREGNIATGLTLASEALDVISAFGEVLDGIRGAFQIDFARVEIDEFNLLDKLTELGRHAKSILAAAQEENWTLFADLLEYELAPLLYEWMAVIPSLVGLLPGSKESEGGEK